MIVFARNLVAKDFWLKAFSLALAILIWLTVWFSIHGESSSSPWLALIGHPPDENIVVVPVHGPSGLTQNFSADPAEVKITLRGDPKVLKSLRTEDIRAQVDLTGIESANGLLRTVEVILPQGVAYTHITPEEVEVRVSPKN
jgi:YbbR domain-containing protein